MIVAPAEQSGRFRTRLPKPYISSFSGWSVPSIQFLSQILFTAGTSGQCLVESDVRKRPACRGAMSGNVQPSPGNRSILICVSAPANSRQLSIESLALTPEHQQAPRGLARKDPKEIP